MMLVPLSACPRDCARPSCAAVGQGWIRLWASPALRVVPRWAFSYSHSPRSLTAGPRSEQKMRNAYGDASLRRLRSSHEKEHRMAAEDKDLNRDPISDETGAHPVGTGLGATGGAVAGAAAGSLGGPLGAAIGGVVGAVVGGLAGKAAAEAVNPTAEEAHWRENYSREPYYEQGRSFDDYAPAYRLGLTGRTRYGGDWDMVEPNLESEWESARGGSSLSWPEARPASRAAWDRIDSQRGMMSDGNRTTDMGYDADSA